MSQTTRAVSAGAHSTGFSTTSSSFSSPPTGWRDRAVSFSGSAARAASAEKQQQTSASSRYAVTVRRMRFSDDDGTS
jgi:hypothetical protein